MLNIADQMNIRIAIPILRAEERRKQLSPGLREMEEKEKNLKPINPSYDESFPSMGRCLYGRDHPDYSKLDI